MVAGGAVQRVAQRAEFISGYIYGGSGTFEPRYILLQILLLQVSYYLLLSTALLLAAALTRLPIGIQSIFDPSKVVFSALEGRILAVATIIITLPMGIFVAWVVERSKKCLDFCCTVLILHCVGVAATYEFPSTLPWWVLHGLACVAMILISERICRRRESEELRFTLPSSGTSTTVSTNPPDPSVETDEGVELVFGRPTAMRWGVETRTTAA
eukprot:Blabericola_migrator_1__4473@NODE_238_length_10988_cov_97_569087_g202_i0_p6_GENE_NODE_238_length_10988_cov_97_569087_g202_i0NODE_238_length_10988_cov_97_569087_g202_i0_p6_ORF_typecomplete_len213_score20_87SYS1/PF09801_9/6_1e33UPF0014/PF03649_13/2_7e03UPF0014/PF03649_13/0_0057_NODE_238_length_10988_cov_97_569087_g202_i018002438